MLQTIGDWLEAPGLFSNAAFGPGGSRCFNSAERGGGACTNKRCLTYKQLSARTLVTMRTWYSFTSTAVASGSREGSACVKRFGF
jgi:hypothetical protein